MMKKVNILLFLLIMLLLINIPIIDAKSDKVVVYVFTKDDDLAASTLNYLNSLKDSEIKDYFEVKEFEVWDKDWKQNNYNYKLASKVAEYYKETFDGSPYIVIGNKFSLDAFSKEHEQEIYNAINDAYNDKEYTDVVSTIKDKIDKENKRNTIFGIVFLILVPSAICFIVAKSRKDLNE